MRNIFITGAGRSGTSMLAGLFAKAGYFFGEHLYPPREANPKGFFEDEEVNALNEKIIIEGYRQHGLDPVALEFLRRHYEGQFWLSRAPGDWTFPASDDNKAAIKRIVKKQPFCLKDPRFCYTIENWLECVPESIVLCVFRDPAITVNSILRECRTAPYLYSANIGVSEAFAIWREAYQRLLNLYRRYPGVYFVNYNDLVSGDAFDDLERLTESQVDRDFPERRFSRSKADVEVEYYAGLVFKTLCEIQQDGFFDRPEAAHMELVRELNSQLDRPETRSYSLYSGSLDAKTLIQSALADEIKRQQDEISALGRTLESTESELARQEELRREAETRAGEADTRAGEADTRAGEAEAALDRAKEQIQEIHQSTSWRITSPLRWFKTFISKLRWLLRLGIRGLFLGYPQDRFQFSRIVFQKLPLPSSLKNKLRDFVVGKTRFLNRAVYGAAGSVGGNLPVQPELLSNTAMRRHLASKPPENERWVLVAEARIPTPDKTSGSTRLFAILDLMSQMGFRITFVSMADREQYHWIFDSDDEFGPHEEKLAGLGVEIIYGSEAAGVHLAEYGYRYTHAFLSYPDVAYELMSTIRAYAINAKVIFDTVDLHGVRFRREAELKDDKLLHEKADYYDKIEQVSIECSDTVIAITEDERKNILEIDPNAQVEVIPNIHSIDATSTGFSDREGLLFIGHYLHSPNQDAVVYFVKEVLPLIHKQLPGVRFTMLGSSITDTVKALASETVEAIGYVEDPVPYFSSHRVFISPLRYGAGMKGKIGQSMSLGLPLVTTAIGAEGMGLEDGRQALICDDPEGFADAVVRLYRDEELWRSISENGLAHIEKNFSYAAVRGALEKVLGVESISQGRAA